MNTSPIKIVYDNKIELALDQIEEHLRGNYEISKRMIGLLLLQDDQDTHELVKGIENGNYEAIQSIISETKSNYSHSLSYLITMSRQAQVREFTDEVIRAPEEYGRGFAGRLSRIIMNPLAGIPILLIVLAILYYSVGVFGAGICVDWLEGTFFS